MSDFSFFVNFEFRSRELFDSLSISLIETAKTRLKEGEFATLADQVQSTLGTMKSGLGCSNCCFNTGITPTAKIYDQHEPLAQPSELPHEGLCYESDASTDEEQWLECLTPFKIPEKSSLDTRCKRRTKSTYKERIKDGKNMKTIVKALNHAKEANHEDA